MASLHAITNEMQQLGSPADVVRRQHLKALSEFTNRPTLIYASPHAMKPVPPGPAAIMAQMGPQDIQGFMSAMVGIPNGDAVDLNSPQRRRVS